MTTPPRSHSDLVAKFRAITPTEIRLFRLWFDNSPDDHMKWKTLTLILAGCVNEHGAGWVSSEVCKAWETYLADDFERMSRWMQEIETAEKLAKGGA